MRQGSNPQPPVAKRQRNGRSATVGVGGLVDDAVATPLQRPREGAPRAGFRGEAGVDPLCNDRA
jgi:hypothetical protein